MIIALLALLGVNLIVVVGLVALVLARKRWVKRQPGAFRGAIRVTEGEVDGLSPKWKRGSGRWVRNVLVWTKAPLLLQNEVLAVDRPDGGGPASADPQEVRRLGDHPVVVALTVDGARIEVAAAEEDLERLEQLGRAGTTSV